jgi:Electron transfer DM13
MIAIEGGYWPISIDCAIVPALTIAGSAGCEVAMKKIVLGLVIGLAAGGFLGFAAGILVFPYWFPPPPAAEAIAGLETKRAVAQGQFIHARPSDPIHWGRGGVTIYADRSGEALVHLGGDFEVGPGPRFHVYLADLREVHSEAAFKAARTVDLGRLRAFQGSQNYPIPAGVGLESFQSVVIWCKEFGVLISPATLTRNR